MSGQHDVAVADANTEFVEQTQDHGFVLWADFCSALHPHPQYCDVTVTFRPLQLYLRSVFVGVNPTFEGTPS